MAESKVQKVARKGQVVKQTAGTCECGGDLVWAKLMLKRGHMVKLCEKCGQVAAG